MLKKQIYLFMFAVLLTASLPVLCDAPYLACVDYKIQKTWKPPKNLPAKTIKVTFRIEQKGSVKDLKIIQSSGSTISDQAALDAITSAAPFDEFPKGSPPSVLVEYTFKPDKLKQRNTSPKQTSAKEK